MDRRSVVVHGHFYQPPREDPWTGRVPLQPSAAPWHDWNERVHDECYRAVVAARILDERGRIAHVMNTLEWISWDAGPTLLDWMAAEEPATYRAFLEADRAARARTGHGNALASPYHHVILPLSTYREKVTEVRWGVTDFRRRFGRDPAGMWLPEAAVDTETLDVLAREGIAFTVLGPTQVRSVPAHGLPGRVRLPGGRSIAVFVYDGPLSHDVAFGQLLRDAAGWVERMAAVPGRLVALATDGETFGHHHRWGDMALAATLMMAGRRGLRLEGFAAFLERNPPVEEIEIVEPSSWSCVHGVERWRSDCGCKADPSKPTSQAWRRPLREGLDELAAALHTRYAQETGRWLGDPWALRDAYVSVLGLDARARAELVRRYASRPLSDAEVSRTLELLEAERDALRMLSSCAWFFDDVARIEPLQALHYAAHALHLVGSGAGALESRLLSRLRHAKSNDPAEGTAADLWRRKVRGVVRTDERRARRVTPAAVRAVARALASPTADSVDAALRAIDATPDGELLPVQTELARGLALRDEPGPELARLADRLGVAPDPGTGGLVRAEPLRFVVALHLHQPLGNFDSVIEQHVDEVYLPVLRRFEERGFLPLALHVSGPLLEWLEARAHRFLDLVGELAGRGALELLLAGFYEPVLPALSREDRLDQIGRMRRWLSSRFGVEARGLWLTERVWEPGLVGDLADAGVEHVFVDDRHLLASGFERHELARPWRALSGGRALAVLPIDERLRYMVPFRSAEEVARELRARAEKGRALAVLGDDGEKLGGWPGTAELVWGRGWLDAFLDEMERLVDEGAVRLASPAEALREVPPGKRAYLPSASYREMEGWALPPAAVRALERGRDALAADPEAAERLHGGYWPSFLARYEESARMHAKAERLSRLCRAAGDPEPARLAVARAQCNDAYWHGVFGGLYLKHLRDAVWASLAEAERILRAGEGLAFEREQDGGTGAILVHSSRFAARVEPERGGRVVELTDLAMGVNLANVLTRRHESYHRVREPRAAAPARPVEASAEVTAGANGTEDPPPAVSIHETEARLGLEELPPVDAGPRALLLDRVLAEHVTERAYAAADYEPVWSWEDEPFEVTVERRMGALAIALRASGPFRLDKTLSFHEDGTLEVAYVWDPAAFPPGARFAPELSLGVNPGEDPGIRFGPDLAGVWRHEIRTVSKSESGFEETYQGLSLTPLWPCAAGSARLVIPAGADRAAAAPSTPPTPPSPAR